MLSNNVNLYPIFFAGQFEAISLIAVALGGVSAFTGVITAYLASRKNALIAASRKEQQEEMDRNNIRTIEKYLKNELERQTDRGQRTAFNISSRTGIPTNDVERLAPRSTKIQIRQHVNRETGLVDNLLYQYGDSNMLQE